MVSIRPTTHHPHRLNPRNPSDRRPRMPPRPLLSDGSGILRTFYRAVGYLGKVFIGIEKQLFTWHYLNE
ncbi:MAG: hypothetical protein KJO08_11555 [Gammaproteobacteria bacterium]|nr:hypothetical protein [Gammaproteobacteria bacterium]